MAEIDKDLQAAEDTGEASEPRLYELGYHIVPTVAEESLGEEVTAMRDIVESNGGVIMKDAMPQYMQLAYEIAKEWAGARKRFKTAYFGWMQFTASPDSAEKIKKAVRAYKTVLRFLLIRAEEYEPVTSGRVSSLTQKGVAEPSSTNNTGGKPDKADARNSNVSEEELDKTIDELVNKEPSL